MCQCYGAATSGRALTLESTTAPINAANEEATLVVTNTIAGAYAIRTNGNIQINSWIETGGEGNPNRHRNVMIGTGITNTIHPGYDFGSSDGLVVGPASGPGAGQSFQVDASSGDVRVGVYTTGAPTDRYTEMDGATGDITMQGSNMIINFNDDAATNTYALAVTHNGSTAASTGGAAQFAIPTGASGANGPVVRIERGQPSANVTAALELAVTSVTDQNSALTISHAGQSAASALNIQFDNVNNQSRAIVVDNGHTVLAFGTLSTQNELQQSTATIINWTGGNIPAAWLPTSAIAGQLLFIIMPNDVTVTDGIGNVSGIGGANGEGAMLIYTGANWVITSGGL
jgi:hypothetical protein